VFLDFYNLKEQPFGVTPDPGYLYLSPTHREALASLVCGVNSGRGFIGLIAKPGMGKTTLLFRLLDLLKESAKTVFLFQSQCTAQDFLRSLLTDLRLEDDGGDFVRMHARLNEVLLHEFQSGRRFVVVIDEAQNLGDPVLEVVRMLSNFETSSDKLIQIILAGQPQLAEKLLSPNLIQLRQRISIMCRLKPFTPAETKLYIDHRLGVAGYDNKVALFTDRAQGMIAKHSEGIPRNINNLCFNSMALGRALEKKVIDHDVVAEVVSDLDLGSLLAASAVDLNREDAPRFTISQSTSGVTSEPIHEHKALKFALAGAFLLTLAWPIIGTNQEGATPPGAELSETVGASSAASASDSLIPVENTGPGSASTAAPLDTSSGNAAQAGLKAVLPSDPPAGTGQSSRPIQVAPHQTLYQICLENYGKFDKAILAQIYELNPWLTNPEDLRPGQVLFIPSAVNDSQAPRTEGIGTSSDSPEKAAKL
jgi:type II secretory pathway predicted ATPase ExeA